ncbi:MAG: hypothetical protein Q8O31_05490 [Rhodocyclaceae bacterium]|nr:hypothetical protein [Rhodocyclaceae bacterium]
MQTMTVGEFKTRFSEVLNAVQAGETIAVCYGRNRRKVATMMPYAMIKPSGNRPLGLLKGKVSIRFSDDFALTDDTLLQA